MSHVLGRCWFLIVAVLATMSASAAPFTSNGTGGGDWNTAATWGGVGVPGTGDAVTITGGDTVFVTDVQSVSTILIQSASTLRIDTGGSLTVDGSGTAVTINAPAVAGNSSLSMFGGTMTLANGGIAVNGDPSNGVARINYDSSGGTLTVKTDISFSNPPNAQLSFAAGGTLNMGGNLGANGAISAGSSTIVFNGAANQSIGGPYTLNAVGIDKPSGTASLAAATTMVWITID